MIENLTKAFEPLDVQGNGEQMMQDAFIKNNPEPFGQRYLRRFRRARPSATTIASTSASTRRGATLLLERGYNDVILFNPQGFLIYSVQKFDDFATDFAKGSGNPLSEGELGKLFAKVAAHAGRVDRLCRPRGLWSGQAAGRLHWNAGL